jgi:hypothetical protein
MNISILIVRQGRVIICKDFREMWGETPSADVDAHTTGGQETGAAKNGCLQDQAWIWLLWNRA